VCCCIVEHEKCCLAEQHVATGKHQKGIEKRNIFFGHMKSYFLKNKVIFSSILGHNKMALVIAKTLKVFTHQTM